MCKTVFSEEFKRESGRLFLQPGASKAGISRELAGGAKSHAGAGIDKVSRQLAVRAVHEGCGPCRLLWSQLSALPGRSYPDIQVEVVTEYAMIDIVASSYGCGSGSGSGSGSGVILGDHVVRWPDGEGCESP